MSEEERRIISVSRRTDVPAFYTDWFLNRLHAGFAEYDHPFVKRRSSVSLRPGNVSAFLFWSKNFAPLLPHLPKIAKDYHFYCHFTITGLPSYLEPNVPPAEETLPQARMIASVFSPHHLQWRFDPIFLNDEITPEATLQRFSFLAQSLEGCTTRGYTSFAIPYPKALYRLQQANISLKPPTPGQKQEIMAHMAEIAAQHGIALYSCCEDALVTAGCGLQATDYGSRSEIRSPEPRAQSPEPAVLKGRCVDPEILAAIGSPSPSDLRPAPTRRQCGCFKSFDIGAYATCPHLCLYCYANSNPQKVRENHARHNRCSPSLSL